MGFGGISPFQLIIILLIVLLLFGGKRLRSLGSDLGSAIKGFRKSMDDSDKGSMSTEDKALGEERTLENTPNQQTRDQPQAPSKTTPSNKDL